MCKKFEKMVEEKIFSIAIFQTFLYNMRMDFPGGISGDSYGERKRANEPRFVASILYFPQSKTHDGG